MEEEWKIIEEFPNWEISNLGVIRNIVTKKIKYTRIKKGRVETRFNRDKKRYERFLSRLLAIAFLPNDNPQVKTEVNHIDENPLNNKLENLEWLSHIDNLNHATRNVRAGIEISKAWKRNPNRPLRIPKEKVYQYNKERQLIKEYQSINDVSNYGFNASWVCQAIKKNKIAYGYIWKKEKINLNLH